MAAGPILFGELKSTHPRLDLAYAERLRSMYKGGRSLLRNERVMRQVFPKHQLESESSYIERCNRAYYDNDMAMVINKMLAGLAQDPLHFDDGGMSQGMKDADVIPPYWADLEKDARPPGESGPKKTLSEIVTQAICEALICGWGWMCHDMPRAPTDEEGRPLIDNRLDEERLDLKRVYMVPYRVDQVLDWMYDENEALLWVKTYDQRSAAKLPGQSRGAWTVYTWKIWDAESIATYQLILNPDGKDKDGTEWKDDMPVSPIEEVPHSFGTVPWVCFDASTPDEACLWLGDQLESRCRNLFNVGNADDHLRRQGSFPQLYEFLGKEDGGPDEVIPENQTNPHRASRSQRFRAPDIIQLRGSEDKAQYVSPPMDGSAANRVAIQDGRDIIPKVVGMLAYVNDASGAMLRRSGDSKKQDKISEQVLMGAIGVRGVAFANACKEMCARGRGEDPDKSPKLRGFENFDTEDAATRIDELVSLANAPIESATFKVDHQILCIQSILGNAVDPLRMAKYREELESTITQDSINQANMPPVPPGHQLDKTGKPVPLPPRTEPDGPKKPAFAKK